MVGLTPRLMSFLMVLSALPASACCGPIASESSVPRRPTRCSCVSFVGRFGMGAGCAQLGAGHPVVVAFFSQLSETPILYSYSQNVDIN